jgi:hypothetical protein
VTGLVGGQSERRRQFREGCPHPRHEAGDLGTRFAHGAAEDVAGRHGEPVFDGFDEG